MKMSITKKDIKLAEYILKEAGFSCEVRQSVQENRISIKNLDTSVNFQYQDSDRVVDLTEFCKNGVFPLNKAFIKE